MAGFVGLVRFRQSSPAPGKDPSQLTRDDIIAALRQQPESFVGNASAGIVLPESFAEARSVTRLGDFPLIVLTAGQSFDFRNAELNRQAGAYQQVWVHEIQPKLVKLSTRGRQIDRKSTRLNSSHEWISYAVFCLKKKKKKKD